NGGNNDDGLSHGRLVGQRNIELRRHSCRSNLFEPAQSAPGQLHARLSGRQVDYPQIAPKDPEAEAGPERLRARLLGGEPAGVARGGIGASIAFPPFGVREDAVEEAIAVTLDDLFDAADVDQITAEADDHRIALSRAPVRQS